MDPLRAALTSRLVFLASLSALSEHERELVAAYQRDADRTLDDLLGAADVAALGATAAMVGRQPGDILEAVADAVTGANERLKEFGIINADKFLRDSGLHPRPRPRPRHHASLA